MKAAEWRAHPLEAAERHSNWARGTSWRGTSEGTEKERNIVRGSPLETAEGHVRTWKESDHMRSTHKLLVSTEHEGTYQDMERKELTEGRGRRKGRRRRCLAGMWEGKKMRRQRPGEA